MKVVYNWLKEFVEVPATAEELASRLALSGTNIGGVEKNVQGGVIDAEVTSNRPDCLGLLGIAREVGAIYKTALKNVSPKPKESGAAKASDAVSVKIEAPELCGRFTARVIRGVKVAPSPVWMRERLEAAGVASISNVVDVSNYVMLELGHPLHTFDYDLVRNHSIVVRRSKPGEKLKTLDGIERTLPTDACMIADGDGSRLVGVGGIMGGADDEAAYGGFDTIWARRRSGDGGSGVEASCGIDFAIGGRRAAERRGRCLSGKTRGEKDYGDARGDFAGDGRGRSGQGNRTDFGRAGVCAGACGAESRAGRCVARVVGVHAAVVARGSGTRD